MKNSLNKTEKKTQEYFESCGYKIFKVPEQRKKTPDFENDEILVEVKEVSPLEVGGLQNDSTYNAIKNNLQNSANKFRDYDFKHFKKHFVIIFSNDITKDDIFSVWTGSFSPNNPQKILSSGMLLSNEHKQHIDGVVWFKKLSDLVPKFVWATDKNNSIKCFFPSLFFSSSSLF